MGCFTESVPLDAVGGALALCGLDGAVLGASRAAQEILVRLGGAADHVPDALWTQLERATIGEAVIWSPTGRAGVLGCTRYSVGSDRALLVMREISLKQDQLVQQLQRHRAKTIESLVLLLAHDLRSPLASIVFNLDVLRERWEELDPTTTQQCLEESQSATDQLRGTIDALIDLVRIGPPRASSLHAKAIVARLVALTRPLFRQAGHELVVRVSADTPAVRVNGLAVQQILLNLLVNAVEASSKPITIELIAAPTPDHEGVAFRVRDYGPGISREDEARLFQPFFTTKSTGTGLGLALARETAISEQGSLRFVPVDQGACFELVLPSGKASE